MRFFILLKIFIIISTAAMADIYLKPNMRTEGKELSRNFTFYGKFVKTINQTALKKYCDMPPQLAKKYLTDLAKTAEVVPIDAYQYGLLIGFAECLEKNIDDASYYLEMASHDNISEASFVMGIISLEDKAVNAAKKYFKLAAKDNHSDAYYNLGLLESKNLRHINKRTVDFLKNSSMSGNLKAQHDYAITMLKLFLNSKISLKKSEIIHFQNVLNNIVSHTNDIELMSKAQNNLNHLSTLRTNFIVVNYKSPLKPSNNRILSQNKITQIAENKTTQHNKNTEKKVIFSDFENHGLADFERHIYYENKLFSGS